MYNSRSGIGVIGVLVWLETNDVAHGLWRMMREVGQGEKDRTARNRSGDWYRYM